MKHHIDVPETAEEVRIETNASEWITWRCHLHEDDHRTVVLLDSPALSHLGDVRPPVLQSVLLVRIGLNLPVYQWH